MRENAEPGNTYLLLLLKQSHYTWTMDLEAMDFVGVDACKKGWFAVALNRRGNWDIGIFNTIDDFWSASQRVNLLRFLFELKPKIQSLETGDE